MIQTLDETQDDIRALAVETFARFGDPARLEQIEATAEVFDAELWAELARTGLLGVAIPDEHGGLGLGMLEAVLVLEGAGAAVTMTPFAETLCAAWLIATFGTAAQQSSWLPRIAAGEVKLTIAPATSVTDDGLVGVPWLHLADAVIHAAGGEVFLLEPNVESEPQVMTSRVIAGEVSLAGGAGERLGEATAADLAVAWRIVLGAFQAGITEAAVRMTAAYTSGREQFGKPLSTFQGVALRAADAWIDAKAIKAAARCAAWTLDESGSASPATRENALIAAWWAAEAGQRCVHATQHLHGGMGADVTYPVHRYFLFGKQIELLLGGASALLAELGDLLAA